MPAVTRKMADLKDEILSKIDQKFNELKLEFLSELKDQIKKEVSEAIKTEIKKREELESTVSLLQEHVKNFQKQMCMNVQRKEKSHITFCHWNLYGLMAHNFIKV